MEFLLKYMLGRGIERGKPEGDPILFLRLGLF